MTIHISHNQPTIISTEIRDIYIENGWGKTTDYQLDDIERAFNHSSFVFCAIENQRIIGFLRGFSDHVFCSWIAEILVLPNRQRQGIGSQLLSQLKKTYGHTAIYSEIFDGTEDFFELNGITLSRQMWAVSRRANNEY